MTIREWVSIGGLILALLSAAVSYGSMRSELADARKEIELIRSDLRAINQHFILWAADHRDQ